MGFPAKGGRFLEAVAKADTIVFGKTGTLTYATPTVAAVVPFGGHDEAEMCISSLFNISVARFRTLFIRLTHSIWSPAFSVSVMPSASAIFLLSEEKAPSRNHFQDGAFLLWIRANISRRSRR